ncbi:2,6-dihydropseudooxynicotine hydrolase [Aquicella siphonis]|uniref:2,6-dihydropseudooxynicotine hydrolase n=1 Tax=Aquicella siphonis TaxID=254247 RepID=A0A5E4PLV6_9COXI|nr:alpha/beta hydrolase [Aquicella siphonis]VVC77206.1 2,6-dihydropseudooxynicotine hydrolase [Aquicella siphonis]
MGLLTDNAFYDMFAQRALTRCVYGGADIGECLSAVERIGNHPVDIWYQEWLAIADRLAKTGDDCLARHHLVSAREAYLRATTYFHASYMPLFGRPLDPRLTHAFSRECETFQKAARLFSPAIECLEIPFENITLPAYFIKADHSGRPGPTLIHTNGYDSNIQEMYFNHVPAAVRRGYHCLLFDGPGQGRNLIRDDVPMRPDWETVVRPVIDYALTRTEIDPQKMVLAGWSFGGFLAPRAAAFEHRIAALVADPGVWDLGPAMNAVIQTLPLKPDDKANFPHIDPKVFTPIEQAIENNSADPVTRWRLLQRGKWVHHADSLFDYLRIMRDFEVSSVAKHIRCPALIACSEGDPLSQSAPALYEAIQAPKTLLRFTRAEGAGGHCEALARTLYHQRVFDWLDETLGYRFN